MLIVQQSSVHHRHMVFMINALADWIGKKKPMAEMSTTESIGHT